MKKSAEVKVSNFFSRRDFLKFTSIGLGALFFPSTFFLIESNQLPPLPTKEAMTKFLLSPSIVRSLDINKNLVPLGVDYLANNERTNNEIAYARAEVIPWEEPLTVNLAGEDIIVAPVVIPAAGDIFNPHLEYINFGKAVEVRVANSYHPDRITKGEGKGSLDWNTVDLDVIKDIMSPGRQTRLHVATTPIGIAGILQNPSEEELKLIADYGAHTADIMTRLKIGDENIPDGHLVAYNFWVETI